MSNFSASERQQQLLGDVKLTDRNFSLQNLGIYSRLEQVAAEDCNETSTLLPPKQIVLHGKHQSLVSFMRILCEGLCFLSLSLKMCSSCSQREGQGSVLLTCPQPGESGSFTGNLLLKEAVVVLQGSSESLDQILGNKAAFLARNQSSS